MTANAPDAPDQPLQQRLQANELTSPSADGNQNDRATSTNHCRTLIEKWGPTVGAIITATKDAFPASPHGTTAMDPSAAKPSREQFRHYWHNIFTHLLETIESDDTIPHHLTSPPVTKFIIKLFDKPESLCCPCTLPDAEPTLTLERDDGVTKGDLVRELRDYLYGEREESPGINTEVRRRPGSPRVPREACVVGMDMPLVYFADWMSLGNDEEGETVAYPAEVPRAFMYCCKARKFDKRRAQLEARRRIPRGEVDDLADEIGESEGAGV